MSSHFFQTHIPWGKPPNRAWHQQEVLQLRAGEAITKNTLIALVLDYERHNLFCWFINSFQQVSAIQTHFVTWLRRWFNLYFKRSLGLRHRTLNSGFRRQLRVAAWQEPMLETRHWRTVGPRRYCTLDKSTWAQRCAPWKDQIQQRTSHWRRSRN